MFFKKPKRNRAGLAPKMPKFGFNLMRKLGVKTNLKELKRKQKKKIKRTCICIAIAVLLIVVILIVAPIVQWFMVVGNIVSLGFFDDSEDISDGGTISPDWTWSAGGNGGTPGVPGNGLYPTDKSLLLRAQTMEIMQSAIDTSGAKIKPAWILGISIREAGQGIFSYAQADDSPYTSLCMPNSYCGQNAHCSWLKAGVSHIENGTVSGSTDVGDPYTNNIRTNPNNANASMHAVGPYQFEAAYVYSHLKYKFNTSKMTDPGAKPIAKADITQDTSLGFVRPNVFFIPDSTYSTVMSHQEKMVNLATTASQYSGYSALSAENQNAVLFCMGAYTYGSGNYNKGNPAEPFIQALINYLGTGKTINDIKTALKATFTDARLTANVGWANVASVAVNLGLITDASKHMPIVGLTAICVGEIYWDNFSRMITADIQSNNPSGGGGSGGGGGSLTPSSSWIFPLRDAKSLSSNVGYRTLGGKAEWHKGLDVAALEFTNIFAVANGVVTASGYDTSMGNYITYAIDGGSYSVTYMHMAKPSSLSKGAKVAQGDEVGKVGSTGYSTGSHLHFQVESTNSLWTGNANAFNNGKGLGNRVWLPPNYMYNGNMLSLLPSGTKVYNKNQGLGGYAENSQVFWSGKSVLDWGI